MLRFSLLAIYVICSAYPIFSQTDSTLTPPGFLFESGFYRDSLRAVITAAESDQKIYFTLDGSIPDSSSYLYNSPLLITKTTVLRACIMADTSYSICATNTYFINETIKLPVVSVSTNPANLWDNEIGIYVVGDNPKSPNYSQDWERPIHLEFFEPNGVETYSIDAGVKIYGESSRGFGQKSLAVYARKIYGYGKINYRLFPEQTLEEFESILLRNSGTDWNKSMFRDALSHILVRDIDIDRLAYRPAILFLNGEYWGIHNIREKPNDTHIAAHYDLETDSLELIRYWGVFHMDNEERFQALADYVLTHDLSIPVNYEYIKNRIDISEFINYLCIEIYNANTDWPCNNVKLWAPLTGDYKWRWLLYDTDYGFDLTGEETYKYYSLNYALGELQLGMCNPDWSTFWMRNLFRSEEFKNNFINRIDDLLNSCLGTKNVVANIDSVQQLLEPDISRHFSRWQADVQVWYENVAAMKKFARERPFYLLENIKSRFNLQGRGRLTVSAAGSAGGRVKVNSLIIEEFPWEGEYFSGINISLIALPEYGGRFVGWSEYPGVLSDTLILPMDSLLSVTPIFAEDKSSAKIAINEINYNSSPNMDTDDWIELLNHGDTEADLSGWVFRDDNDLHAYTIPEDVVLQAGEFLVLCAVKENFLIYYSDLVNVTGNFDFKLNNAGEHIRLYDRDGLLVDSLTYDDEDPWPVEADGTGRTLELLHPSRDNSRAENWAASTSLGSPGKMNTVYTTIAGANELFPGLIMLHQNLPNPFNSRTVIRFSLRKGGIVRLGVYDILGREIGILINESKNAGSYQVEFDAADLASGIYFYRLQLDQEHITMKMLLLE